MYKLFNKLVTLLICYFPLLIISFAVKASEQTFDQNLHVVAPLMPMPQNITKLHGQLQLSENLTIALPDIQKEALIPLVNSSLFASQFKQLNFSTIQKGTQNNLAGQLIINVAKLSSPYPELSVDESYQLNIDNEVIVLNSQTQFGMLHGLSTLSQLLHYTNEPYRLNNQIINDHPQYPWRGLLFDSVRHFLPIEDVKRTLRGLATAKMNVFHWHLTDDQGWRIELKSYPKLHKLSSNGQYYTQQQIKEIVAYAAKLGIRVVPEFDVPGHASAIVLAYPELSSGTTRQKIEHRWGVFKTLLDPSNPNVYTFVDDVVAELSTLFPDPYFHIGGDEVDAHDWQQNKKIQAFMIEKSLKDDGALHAYFNQRIAAILAKYHKKMIGWDEVLHPSLPKNTLVQSWRGHHSLENIITAGHDGLLSSGYYIDQPQWSSYHYRNHPNATKANITQALENIGRIAFNLKRFKGKDISGEVHVFSEENNKLGALIYIKNKGYFFATPQVFNHDNSQRAQLHNQYSVTIDTWMGPTKIQFDLKNNYSSNAFIGNTPYPLETKPLKVKTLAQINQILLEQQTKKTRGKIIGGEATIWSEMVTTDNLDVRIWPRLYVIGERFWSSDKLINEEYMYQRLPHASHYGEHIAGLLHKKQLEARLQHYAQKPTDIMPLLLFSRLIEPAHYYTLHHLAYLRSDYHQQASLDQLHDVLPVESLMLKQFDIDVKSYAVSCNNDKRKRLNNSLAYWKQALSTNKALFQTMTQWQDLYSEIILALKSYEQLDSLHQVKQINGSVTQVVASINQFKLAQNKCNKS